MSQPTRNITADEKRAMQQRLKDLGFYHDEVDGLWGKNSVAAMKQWQHMSQLFPDDGIPTYQQMVALGATVPEVIPTKPPRSSAGGGVLLNLLLRIVLLILPKVNLPMNPVLLALGRINKATIATVVSFLATVFLLFGIDISPDLQGVLITLGTAVVTGLAAWLIPNAAPSPVSALATLNKSLSRATGQELVEYNRELWPADGTANYTTAGGYPAADQPDAPQTEAEYLNRSTGGGDAPSTGH